MAVTQNTYTGDGSTVLYSFTFPYLTQTDVKVKLDGATQATTAYSFANATTVQMGSAPGSGVKVIIYRDTDNDNKKATFYPGSAIKAEDLNDNYDQILYVAQEVDNNSMSSLGDTPMQGDMEFAQGMGLVFEGATTDNFETRLTVADPTADRTVTLPNVTGTVITTGDTGTVTSAMITDATIVNADINASAAIAQSKLNIANATTSAAGYQSAADKTKLDGIETAATADQTNAEIRAAVEAATDSNVFTDADHTKLNAIEASATADQTAAEIRTLVESASDSNVFTDADHTKLNGIETAATADQTASEIKTLIASSPLDASHLAADSVTTSELADAELTTLAGMQSGTASILASGTALTSTTTELNQLDGKTLGETTLTTNSNTAIPTSKAVNDRIVSVTNALGGFVAIADKDNFPTSHPDPGEDAGTVVSISNAVGISVNSSGVGSLATRAGGSDAVVINGFPSALRGGATVGSATNANPYVLPANVGLQVQTTSTAHTYDYHKYLINEEDANKLSGDIQDFQERYRVSSSAPTSSLNDGDLYFDTTQNKMKVYNLSSTSWDDVATPGNFFIATLSPAFDGSTTQFTITNAPNSAQQIILSLNGVVQKPGTAFTLSGSTVTFASAPVSGSDYFAVVMGSAVNIGTPSNNTVTTAILQNGSCTTDKLSTDAVTGAKIADDAVGAEHIEVLDANLQFADNAKAQFGTTDNDLEIYHDGSSSYIANTTGPLIITQHNSDIHLRPKTADEGIIINNDGSVELYYDNVKKIESTSGGAQIVNGTGNTQLNIRGGSSDGTATIQFTADDNAANDDNFRLQNGASNDFYLQNYASGSWETNIKAVGDGSVELYEDGIKKLETTSVGIKVLGAEGGDAWLELYADEGDDNADKWGIKSTHVGNEFAIQNYSSGSWQTVFKGTDARAAELHYQGTKKIETTSTGATITGKLLFDSSGEQTIKLADNRHIHFGTDADLKIYHSGDNAHINHLTSGNMFIDAVGDITIRNTAGTENRAKFINNGAVELYHNNLLSYTTLTSGGAVQSNSTTVSTKYKTSEGTTRGHVYANASDNIGFLTNSGSWAFRLESDKDYMFYGNNISDRDRKDNITTVTGTSLDKITKLVPKTYNWKATDDGKTSTDRTFTGFIAQEVKEHLPSLVTGTDGQKNMAVDYNGILAHAVKAIQELSAKVETLETKVAALEAK